MSGAPRSGGLWPHFGAGGSWPLPFLGNRVAHFFKTICCVEVEVLGSAAIDAPESFMLLWKVAPVDVGAANATLVPRGPHNSQLRFDCRLVRHEAPKAEAPTLDAEGERAERHELVRERRQPPHDVVDRFGRRVA